MNFEFQSNAHITNGLNMPWRGHAEATKWRRLKTSKYSQLFGEDVMPPGAVAVDVFQARRRTGPAAQLTIAGCGIGRLNFPPWFLNSACCRMISSAKFQAMTNT